MSISPCPRYFLKMSISLCPRYFPKIPFFSTLTISKMSNLSFHSVTISLFRDNFQNVEFFQFFPISSIFISHNNFRISRQLQNVKINCHCWIDASLWGCQSHKLKPMSLTLIQCEVHSLQSFLSPSQHLSSRTINSILKKNFHFSGLFTVKCISRRQSFDKGQLTGKFFFRQILFLPTSLTYRHHRHHHHHCQGKAIINSISISLTSTH